MAPAAAQACEVIEDPPLEGCIGRCDVTCDEAQEPQCDRICGGMNHGGGLALAIDHARCYAEVMIETYAGAHDQTSYRRELGAAVEQLSLF